MTAKLTLYTRQECCLCDAMKAVIAEVAVKMPIQVVEVDVDGDEVLRAQFGGEVPVLFIDGRKAFKYKTTAAALTKRVGARRPWFSKAKIKD